MLNNPKLDVISINVYAKFGQNPSQDIDWKQKCYGRMDNLKTVYPNLHTSYARAHTSYAGVGGRGSGGGLGGSGGGGIKKIFASSSSRF